MIKQYFTQAWAQLRQQPLMSAVGIAGTALAIFLIMLVVMMQQVKVAPTLSSALTCTSAGATFC